MRYPPIVSGRGKYGAQNARAARRRARRSSEAAAAPELEAWPVPPEGSWDPASGDIPYQPTATARITERIGRVDGRLVFYAIMLHCRNERGEWINIWRTDCRHGTVHRHDVFHGMSNPVVLQPITSQHDVESTYRTSYAEVEDNWEEMESRWRSGEGDRA